MHVHPIISDKEFIERKETTLRLMAEKNYQLLIVISGFQVREGHVCYLTNHRIPFVNELSRTGMGYAAWILFSDGSNILIAPDGYQRDKVINVDAFNKEAGLFEGICSVLKKKKYKDARAGIAGMDVLPADGFLEMRKEFTDITFENADALIENQRMKKSSAEIQTLIEAARIGVVGMQAGLAAAVPGASQLEVEMAIRQSSLIAGADFISQVRVSNGKSLHNSAWPPTSQQVLCEGDFLYINSTGWYGNYAWDISRVNFYGVPNKDQLDYLNLIAEANDWMIEVMKPEKKMEFVFTEARGRMIIPAYHGIGLDLQESPRLHLNQYFTLTPGMVLCVEPIVSSPQYGSMNIKNTLVIKENSVETITKI